MARVSPWSTNLHHEPLAGAVDGGLPELLHCLPSLITFDALDVVEARRSLLEWGARRKASAKQRPTLTKRSF